MRYVSVVLTLVIVLGVAASGAQRMTPTTPGAAGDPQWQAVTRLSDGRSFVTDGGIAIDSAVAKLAKLPEKEYPGIPLNATYIAYLRRVLPVGATRFRVSGELQPIVIVVSGKPVGVLMPVRK